MRAGVIGSLTGAAAGFIGASSAFGMVGRTTSGRVVAHGVVGGAAAEAQGGKFGQGFVSSAFSKSVSGRLDSITKGDPIAGAVASSVVGGTASVLSGGKFKNAALTSAFQYLYNAAVSRESYPREVNGFKATIDSVGRFFANLKYGLYIHLKPFISVDLYSVQPLSEEGYTINGDIIVKQEFSLLGFGIRRQGVNGNFRENPNDFLSKGKTFDSFIDWSEGPSGGLEGPLEIGGFGLMFETRVEYISGAQ